MSAPARTEGVAAHIPPFEEGVEGAGHATMTRMPPRVFLLLAAFGAFALAHAALIAFRIGGEAASDYGDGVALLVAGSVAAVLTARRGRRTADRQERWGWFILSASCASFVLGVLIAIGYYAAWNRLPSGASLTDIPWLGNSALVVIAVLFLGGPMLGRSRARLLLDGGIVASAVLLLSWLTSLHTVYRTGADDPVSFAVALGYPIGDVITVVIALSIVSHARRVSPALLIVVLSTLVAAFSDSAYAYIHYRRPGAIDVGYTVNNLLMAVAAVMPGWVRSREAEDQPAWWQVVLPYVPMGVASIVVLVSMVRGQPFDVVSKLLATTVIGLVLVRQLMAVLETRSLAGRLASTLEEQRILIEQAPVGICRLGPEGRLESVNRSLAAMLELPVERLEGRSLLDFTHPDDLAAGLESLRRLRSGRLEPLSVETRGLRADGTVMWCSTTVGPLRGPDGRVERAVAIIEDISDRKLQAQRAAEVQRRLLPQEAPDLPGYELAGACRPAQDVAGDFYDWLLAADGHLDLTLADVMGKGMPAALVMAVLRTSLRAAPPSTGPAARLSAAARSLALGMEGDFVTLFHARLDPASGRLRYVDAGHGHCAILRAGGELAGLPVRSLPLGVNDEVFREADACLEPGDTLLIWSDGLVDTGEETVGLAELAPDLDASAGAGALVGRLMDRTPARPPDDVTIVALRRTGA